MLPRRKRLLESVERKRLTKLVEAIPDSFSWKDTDQGQDFWNNLLQEMEALLADAGGPRQTEDFEHPNPENKYSDPDAFDTDDPDGLRSASDYIMQDLDWAETPEGHAYWNTIHDKLRDMARAVERLK